jgi:carboxylate-amine ligase
VSADNARVAATPTTTLALGAGSYDPEGFYDEAFAAPGAPREHYADLLAALGGTDLDAAVRRLRRELVAEDCTFGAAEDAEAFPIDLIPRVITADEWAALSAGLEQRVRALDAFLHDVYGEQRCVREGVVPARVVEEADHYEPGVARLPPPRVRVGMAGLDVVRRPDGAFVVLEDNLRTPSGLAYMTTARRVVLNELGGAPGARPVERPMLRALDRVLRSAAPDGRPNPRIALLTDGPGNSAVWEHKGIAARLGIELVTLGSMSLERFDVVYRRTNDDRLLDERGQLTAVGAALGPGLLDGTLACVNAFGNGVADDKLVHAYVEDLVRLYLGEEPLVRSVPTFDLDEPACLAEVLDRLGEMVVKPRNGYGGEGVFVGPTASAAARDRVAGAIRERPVDWIAQETVFFSRHPTVVDGRIVPRHVDLRAFVTFDGEVAEAIPGGLTRVAYDEGELVVNSSQGGGGKDTWVLGA